MTGPEVEVLREQLAKGELVLIERPKPNSEYTACFVCIPA